jgi:hypothetical protein
MKRNVHNREQVRQPLDTESNGPIPKITRARLGYRVVIYIDNAIQIVGDNFCNLMELYIVECVICLDEWWQRDTGQITDRGFLLVGVLDDFGTLPCKDSIEDSHVSLRLGETICIVKSIVVFHR